jgi:hypothetical protein
MIIVYMYLMIYMYLNLLFIKEMNNSYNYMEKYIDRKENDKNLKDI